MVRHAAPESDCTECGASFPHVKALETHIWAKHKFKPGCGCGICDGGPFDNRKAYQDHFEGAAHKDVVRRAMKEYYKAVNMSQTPCPLLEAHGKCYRGDRCLFLHSGERATVGAWCDLCGQDFPSAHALQRHIETHLHSRCVTCNVQLTRNLTNNKQHRQGAVHRQKLADREWRDEEASFQAGQPAWKERESIRGGRNGQKRQRQTELYFTFVNFRSACGKTVLCPHWQGGRCDHGGHCFLAHGEHELRAGHGAGGQQWAGQSLAEWKSEFPFRSVPCNLWERDGGCPYGEHCWFLHGEQSDERAWCKFDPAHQAWAEHAPHEGGELCPEAGSDWDHGGMGHGGDGEWRPQYGTAEQAAPRPSYGWDDAPEKEQGRDRPSVGCEAPTPRSPAQHRGGTSAEELDGHATCRASGAGWAANLRSFLVQQRKVAAERAEEIISALAEEHAVCCVADLAELLDCGPELLKDGPPRLKTMERIKLADFAGGAYRAPQSAEASASPPAPAPARAPAPAPAPAPVPAPAPPAPAAAPAPAQAPVPAPAPAKAPAASAPVHAREALPELRIDAADGCGYTYEDFQEEYGRDAPQKWAESKILDFTGELTLVLLSLRDQGGCTPAAAAQRLTEQGLQVLQSQQRMSLAAATFVDAAARPPHGPQSALLADLVQRVDAAAEQWPVGRKAFGIATARAAHEEYRRRWGAVSKAYADRQQPADSEKILLRAVVIFIAHLYNAGTISVSALLEVLQDFNSVQGPDEGEHRALPLAAILVDAVAACAATLAERELAQGGEPRDALLGELARFLRGAMRGDGATADRARQLHDRLAGALPLEARAALFPPSAV
eukprot:TRINITY_DN434_c0_g1_i1.p1 TRINITY_DN434_c0_g1~~TRINITY_DN434_c0_g1_i1.p1  ORF type:complete len:838 (+),score=123.50 TRINITY_DN434_c0_g1_i1:93-2606(+)